MVGAAINAAARTTTGFSYSGRSSRAPRHVRRKSGDSVAGNACTNNPAGGFTASDRSPASPAKASLANNVAAAGFHRTAG